MRHAKTAAYHTLGCKLNFAETSTIARQLSDQGYARVDFQDGADLYVINTCSVTEQADKKCRNMVRKARGHNPSAKVVVVGCYAQLKPKEISEIPGVDMVLGAQDKFRIADLIPEMEMSADTLVRNSHIKEVKDFFPSYSAGDRTRSFLKIQDGCDYFCSFCTIPLARGRSRSGSVAQVIDKATEIAKQDIKEIVLTGVNIGDFRNELGETFLDVVQAIDQVEGIERIRISSIEPDLLHEDIIDAVAKSRRFMPHFHIPLQSGCDELLNRMRRRYDTALYRSRIAYIRKTMPDACIGVDVIVGFPGEDEAEFQQTVDFLDSLDISYLHVFTYSERKNTTALRMDGVVPMEERRRRNKVLRMMSLKKQRDFYQRYQGACREVLWEANEVNEQMQGFTDNYVKVATSFDSSKVNRIMPVHLTGMDSDGLMIAQEAATTT